MWVPRGVDPSTREVLVEGVPEYLKPALLDWMRPELSTYSRSTGTRPLKKERLREYDVEARPKVPYSTRQGMYWPGFVAQLSDEELLDLADWLIHHNVSDIHVHLDRLLLAASSAWTVGERNGQIGLVRRVPEAVRDAAVGAMGRGSAGALLSEAWSACFGRRPDPEEAYEKAIKAVEEAAAPIVSPKNDRATLGTIVRDMKAQADWKLDLPGVQQDVPVQMMEALWTGQESRHGGNGYRVPTPSEAEAAVLLAVPLVQWFTSGAISRRP